MTSKEFEQLSESQKQEYFESYKNAATRTTE